MASATGRRLGTKDVFLTILGIYYYPYRVYITCCVFPRSSSCEIMMLTDRGNRYHDTTPPQVECIDDYQVLEKASQEVLGQGPLKSKEMSRHRWNDSDNFIRIQVRQRKQVISAQKETQGALNPWIAPSKAPRWTEGHGQVRFFQTCQIGNCKSKSSASASRSEHFARANSDRRPVGVDPFRDS